MQRHLLLALLISILGLGGGAAFADGNNGAVDIEQAWARASVLKSRPAAAYLTIINKSGQPDRLVAVTSLIAGKVTIHLSEMSGGVMKMTDMHSVVIEAGEKLILAPGGMHLMLMQLKQPLRKGGTVRLSLTFERAGEIKVSAPVLSPGAKGLE